MPWRRAVLRGTQVLARCDERGELKAEGGRVEVRYKPQDGKAYRAAPGNLVLDAKPDILPDDHCAEAGPVDSAKSSGGARGTKANVGTPQTNADLIAYTDGACSGNPGPAGLGVVLLVRGERRELSEYLGTATNNIAELTAILRVAEGLEPTSEPLVVHTDSQYAIGVLTKGWKPKANIELIADIKQKLKPFKGLSLVYVKGHAGIPLNERADQLAREAVATRSSPGWRDIKNTYVPKSDGPRG
jgi:ribonuclease HI